MTEEDRDGTIDMITEEETIDAEMTEMTEIAEEGTDAEMTEGNDRRSEITEVNDRRYHRRQRSQKA